MIVVDGIYRGMAAQAQVAKLLEGPLLYSVINGERINRTV
jgi:hypothetical protein